MKGFSKGAQTILVIFKALVIIIGFMPVMCAVTYMFYMGYHILKNVCKRIGRVS
jgi:hypothetical protein